MAPKKVTAAQALAETQEGKDAEKPEAAAATSDTPAVAEKPAVDKEIPADEINRDFSWAAQQIQDGLRVKRAAWIGNKFIDASHRAGKHILLSEDMLATDWIVI